MLFKPKFINADGITNTDVLYADGSGGVDWGKGFNVISSDITYYIAEGGDDTTGNGTISTPFYTPHRVLEEIKDQWILPDATVFIEASAGWYVFFEPIVINHPNSNRIKIIGEVTSNSFNYPIISVGSYQSYITITGSVSSLFTIGSSVTISDDTFGNNGTYTVKSSRNGFRGRNTIIEFLEDLVDPLNVDGVLESSNILGQNFTTNSSGLLNSFVEIAGDHASEIISESITISNDTFGNDGIYKINDVTFDSVNTVIKLESALYNDKDNCFGDLGNYGVNYITNLNFSNCDGIIVEGNNSLGLVGGLKFTLTDGKNKSAFKILDKSDIVTNNVSINNFTVGFMCLNSSNIYCDMYNTYNVEFPLVLDNGCEASAIASVHDKCKYCVVCRKNSYVNVTNSSFSNMSRAIFSYRMSSTLAENCNINNSNEGIVATEYGYIYANGITYNELVEIEEITDNNSTIQL